MKSIILALLFASISVVTSYLTKPSYHTQSEIKKEIVREIARVNETPNRHDASGHKNI